jgi:excisionase family DNA binding protein
VTGASPTLSVVTSTPRLLRPAQVAALLGVARSTVHDYESQGRLEAQRTPGGHRRYPADQPALQAALAAQDAP